MKKLLLHIFLGAAIGLVLVQLFDHNLSPDINFFRTAAAQSDQWAAGLRESDAPCYIICGSSDVRMGVDPEIMLEEEGVRAINASLNAGYGQNLLMLEALHYAKEGDTIVYVPLSPENEAGNMLTGSMKLGFMRHGLGVFEPRLIEPSPSNISRIFLGDIRIINMNIAKRLLRPGNIYRYNGKTSVIHPSGWVELRPCLCNKRLGTRPYPMDEPLSKMGKCRDISLLQEKAHEKGCDFILALPVVHMHESRQAVHTWDALQYVKKGYRVLKDPTFGVVTDADLMADTLNHLNAQGAREHTLRIARALKNGEFWTEEELVEELRRRGWDAAGNYIGAPEAAPAGE